MRKIILSTCFIVFNTLLISSQTHDEISLNEFLSAVEKNNYSIKISEKDIQGAQADYRQSNSVFLPKITVSHTAISTTNPLMAFGSKLNQEILTNEDFDPRVLNDPSGIENFSTILEMAQPLFNADAIQMRKAAKVKINAFELQSSHLKSYLKLEAYKAFMQLQLTHQVLKTLKHAQNTALKNREVLENFYDQGLAQKVDVLGMQVHEASIQNKLMNAQNRLQTSSNMIHYLMGSEETKVISPSEPLQIQDTVNHYSGELPVGRNDIAAMDTNYKAHEYLYKSAKRAIIPRLNAFAQYELHDKNLFGTKAKGHLIGAQLSWDIFEGYKRIGKIQKNKIELEKIALERDQYFNKSQMELSQTIRQFNTLKQQLELSKLVLKQAEESLRIRKNRFEEGLDKTTDLLESESMYLNKKLEYLNTVFQYNLTKAKLDFLTK